MPAGHKYALGEVVMVVYCHPKWTHLIGVEVTIDAYGESVPGLNDPSTEYLVVIPGYSFRFAGSEHCFERLPKPQVDPGSWSDIQRSTGWNPWKVPAVAELPKATSFKDLVGKIFIVTVKR